MKIKLSPIVSIEKTPKISISGLEITIDDTVINLADIPDGGQAEASKDSPFIGIVTRDEVTIKYPYSTDVYSPNQSIDWNDYTFEIEDGEVPNPLKKREDIENV